MDKTMRAGGTGTKGMKERVPLEERLVERPELLERMHGMVDLLEGAVADGSDADEAEDRVVEEMRRLGQDVLGRWAVEAAVPETYPDAIRHGKKKCRDGRRHWGGWRWRRSSGGWAGGGSCCGRSWRGPD